MTARETIRAGRAVLGIEFGSTRIKACLIGEKPHEVIATGSHAWENRFVDGNWTYDLESVWTGVQQAYADLVTTVHAEHGVPIERIAALGVSAMMHGYLAFDENDDLVTPFRTWRNTSTGDAATELTALFGQNIPVRWSIAHLHQAVRDNEAHIAHVSFFTTLAGYVHWKLTDQKVLGVGDASGMFPIDPVTGDYDHTLIDSYDRLTDGTVKNLRSLLPAVLPAGAPAGTLTPAGAHLLDPTGTLQPGAPLCPPEGDAGTGMVATNAIAPRTGNVSAGTSIFAMVVLEKPLSQVHTEIDIVTTPAGDPVAMVHCNNGASELAAWAALFGRFAEACGTPLDSDTVFDVLFREALEGAPDAGGLLAYNHLAGEPVAGTDAGRPLFVRTPDSAFTLANVMRAQIYGVFGTLALGMKILENEHAALDQMYAHGGLFRTEGVAQRFLAAALDAPVAIGDTASEGGAWGIAVLAAYLQAAPKQTLSDYLNTVVFAHAHVQVTAPDPADVAGFDAYLEQYRAGLAVERAAIDAL